MEKLQKKIIGFNIKLAIIILEIYSLSIVFKTNGIFTITFYTDLSNTLALIASICYCLFTALYFKNDASPPNTIKILKLFSTSMLAVTFLVVVFVLIPISGGLATEFILFSDTMLFHHTICPIFAIASFLFFEPNITIKKSDIITSTLPTIIYGIIMISLNISKVFSGPYKFLLVYEQPWFMTVIWCVIIFLISLFIGVFLYKFKSTNKKSP